MTSSEEKYRRGHHCVFLTQYHIIFCPKFRFSVRKGAAAEVLKEILGEICREYDYKIKALEVMEDHVHVFVSCPQTAAPSDIARTLKSRSAVMMFRRFPELKRFYSRCGALWSRGYFVASDGTVKRGGKKWRLSKNGKRLKEECAALSRRAAAARHLAAAEAANHMREHGDVLVTEPGNAAKLMRRAKETTLREDGRANRKKRFGRSVGRRCPGLFQQKVREKFERTGGKYVEVPAMYRASQYDHTSGQYEKKKLSERIFTLSDGTRVQRDCYSALLLFCASDSVPPQINDEKCRSSFSFFSAKERALMASIRAEGRIVKNSGISVTRSAGCRAHSTKQDVSR